MSFTTATRSVLRDGLAVPPAGVIRSRTMTPVPLSTESKLRRAKGRLYVIAQTGGWGAFLFMQIVFIRLFGMAGDNRSTFDAVVKVLMVGAAGLLLTHCARGPMARWGWKELGWGALLPRIAGMAILLSFLWSAFGYGYSHGVLREPWPTKIHPVALFSVSLINGLIVMLGWMCIYYFYHIFERLQRMQVEQFRLAATVKEAELRALKSQVNPHFLFNSLNSLRALIDEDAPRAREAVTRLANMLRYSLQSGQLETVPFEDELRIVEDYLALEQIRHENRLRVRWEIAADTRLLGVPPMLLQTLVENAVKYGIGSRREGGELVITARLERSALNIRVTNPGNLTMSANSTPVPGGASTGLGLRNASERLKLLFGDQASLSLLPEPVGCVTADVFIPLNLPVR